MTRPHVGRGWVREPAVAGRFYEGRPDGSAAAVDEYVMAARADMASVPGGNRAVAERADQEGDLLAVIVPHAGHIYSGPTAGYAYAALTPRVRRVVLLGPAHYVPVAGIGLSTAHAWATPLGEVQVDAELGAELFDGLERVKAADRPHEPEHSLEVQLPFLQRVLDPGFAICPLLVGADLPEVVAEVIRRTVARPDAIALISTDFSHYLDHDTARERDDRTITSILARDADGIGSQDACGRLPLRGLLSAGAGLDWEVRLLDARTSGDTAGSRDRVVGYAAFSVHGARWRESVGDLGSLSSGRSGSGTHVQPGSSPQAERRRWNEWRTVAQDVTVGNGEASGASGLSSIEQRRLLEMARDVIEEALATNQRPRYEGLGLSRRLRRPGASFVTLRSGSGELMGCIGSLAPTRELAADVVGHAFDAAFRDPRFPPLRPDQADDVRLEISVLTPARTLAADDFDDLVARLPVGSGLTVMAPGHRATFLPAVWKELRGSATFVGSLWRKAGLQPWSWPDGIKLEIYAAEEFGDG